MLFLFLKALPYLWKTFYNDKINILKDQLTINSIAKYILAKIFEDCIKYNYYETKDWKKLSLLT